MSVFQFRFSDQEGDVSPDEMYEYQDLLAAIDEAKRVLAEMALDGLPREPGGSIAVEVITSTGSVVAKVGLTLCVDFPTL